MANDERARNYAQAIFEQAVDSWRKALHVANESLAHAEITSQLDNQAESFERKKEQINQTLPANLSNEARNLIHLLASKNELHLLPEILAEFERFAMRGPTREPAWVTSAVALTDSERAHLESKLRTQFGSELDFEYHIDKDLLGGLVVRVGDKVIDGSVKGKLSAMRQKLQATS